MQQIEGILDKILSGDYNVQEFADKSTIPATTIYSWVKRWKEKGLKPKVSFVDGVKMFVWANPGVGQMPISLKEDDQQLNSATAGAGQPVIREKIEPSLQAITDAVNKIREDLRASTSVARSNENVRLEKGIAAEGHTPGKATKK